MSAYVIANVDIHDQTGYANYSAQTPDSIARYGGRFVARGGEAQKLEGGWEPKRVVIIEFESLEQARRWYQSDDYQRLASLRQQAAATDMLVVEGADL
jgi:uncharacterized protein (DUF1330 family)